VAGEAEAVAVLTLLVAVCDQALDALAALDRPVDGALAEHAERVRDLSLVELVNFGRFSRGALPK
jgi:hypothetical protein